MNFESIFTPYKARKLTEADIPGILNLYSENTEYFKHCPPNPNSKTVKEDLVALPPAKEAADKYFIGIFDGDSLIAVLDLIDGYPQQDIAYIGFFMVDVAFQHSGIGSEIISTVSEYLCSNGYSSIRLAWIKGNPQAEHFWRKNGFVPIKETSASVADVVILAERIL